MEGESRGVWDSSVGDRACPWKYHAWVELIDDVRDKNDRPRNHSTGGSVPKQCVVPGLKGEGPGHTAMVRFFVDDVITSLEVMHEENGERCLDLTAALASTHHIMLGERGEDDEQVLAKKTMTDWKERKVILGWVVNTNRGSLSLQGERIDEMKEMSKH